MPARTIPLALIYDFDGTLAPGNMQEPPVHTRYWYDPR